MQHHHNHNHLYTTMLPPPPPTPPTPPRHHHDQPHAPTRQHTYQTNPSACTCIYPLLSWFSFLRLAHSHVWNYPYRTLKSTSTSVGVHVSVIWQTHRRTNVYFGTPDLNGAVCNPNLNTTQTQTPAHISPNPVSPRHDAQNRGFWGCWGQNRVLPLAGRRPAEGHERRSAGAG